MPMRPSDGYLLAVSELSILRRMTETGTGNAPRTVSQAFPRDSSFSAADLRQLWEIHTIC